MKSNAFINGYLEGYMVKQAGSEVEINAKGSTFVQPPTEGELVDKKNEINMNRAVKGNFSKPELTTPKARPTVRNPLFTGKK